MNSTDSNWIFDASSAFPNDRTRQNSLDPTEKYNFLGEGITSGGSDSIHENFAKLKKKSRKKSENKMMISIPSYANQDVFAREKQSLSPRMGSEEQLLFGVKRGNISAMSGMASREDNSSNLLFSINENLRRKKNLSMKPRKKTKKVEEEIIEEMFTNKRKPGEFGNISNLSAVRRKPPRKKQKMRRRRSAFKGINPNQIFHDLNRMRTNQQEKQEIQGRIIDRSCQITKKGKEEIEKMVKNPKTSMIYSEIDSANSSDELADTVKPLDFKDSNLKALDKRKITFGFKMTNNMFENGKLNMEEMQKKFMENSQLNEEIQRGIKENFGNEESEMNKSDFPKLQTQRKKKKKKTGSMRVMKNVKSEKKKKKKTKPKTKNKKTKDVKKSAKRNGKSKKNLIEKKKNNKVQSRQNLDKVISRYGIPLLPRKESKNEKMVSSKIMSNSNISRIKKKESKVNFGKKKRNSILFNSTIEAALKQGKNSKKKEIKKKGF